MQVTLHHRFRFEAAHRLPNVPVDHPCARLHGHSYVIELEVEGEVDEAKGWLIDYGDIAAVADPVIAELDHRCLNDLPGLDNPTSELLCGWLWERIFPKLPGLVEVRVAETPEAFCAYRGP